jgi:hypothetical protein
MNEEYEPEHGWNSSQSTSDGGLLPLMEGKFKYFDRTTSRRLTPARVKAELGTDQDLRDTMKNMLRDKMLRRPDIGTYAVYILANGW